MTDRGDDIERYLRESRARLDRWHNAMRRGYAYAAAAERIEELQKEIDDLRQEIANLEEAHGDH